MAAADVGRGVLTCMLAILEPRHEHVKLKAGLHRILEFPRADAD